MSTFVFNQCPICFLESEKILPEDNTVVDVESYPHKTKNDTTYVNCKRCSKYLIDNTLAHSLMIEGENRNFMLSSRLRRYNIEHVFEQKDNHETSLIYLDNNRYKRMLEADPLCRTTSEKQSFLLESWAILSEYPGHSVHLDCYIDVVLACAANDKEFIWHLKSLFNRGLIEILRDLHPSSPYIMEIAVTAEGWNIYEKNKVQLKDSQQVFVAMSFSKDMNNIYDEAIKPAIVEAGYKPYRVDKEPHGERIDAKIISEIRKSRFLVADVTEHKNGVYYEAGYAQGMGIPVIWSVCKNELKQAHFDTRQFQHILWNEDELDKFREELKINIEAFIGP